MQQKIRLYNTISRKKELFTPIVDGYVGLYVCGPTVYGDAHLGHARPGITFDIVYRYLQFIGNKVRYVRNITDVGHLENDADEGEDKIAKKARLEKVEPMEVVQHYTDRYHRAMDSLNVNRPSIEPRASGHIIEQQEIIQKILDNGFAYEANGSVYFDVEKYNEKNEYGKLSGRKLEDLQANTRALDGQSEKRKSFDFALWKKAAPEHIMRWTSPWSDGFPGWHVECTAMGNKYLGEEFDIHGGGMDLMFPHHECEIAQSVAAFGKESVRKWMHNNMITINGQKMGKALGNFITLFELFDGSHKLLEQAFSPQTIRFFILQAHYRSTLNFSNDALKAAETGQKRLFAAIEVLNSLCATKGANKSDFDIAALKTKCYEAMNDDFNTPILISHLFGAVRFINSVQAGKAAITEADLAQLKSIFDGFVFDVMGLKVEETPQNQENSHLNKVVDLLLNIRIDAKKNRNFELADKIRNDLAGLGFIIKDTKDGFEWELNN